MGAEVGSPAPPTGPYWGTRLMHLIPGVRKNKAKVSQTKKEWKVIY